MHFKGRENLTRTGDFLGYKIYRSENPGEEDFVFSAILPRWRYMDTEKKYYDPNIETSKRYTYTISILRKDGIEGPLSDPADERDGRSSSE